MAPSYGRRYRFRCATKGDYVYHGFRAWHIERLRPRVVPLETPLLAYMLHSGDGATPPAVFAIRELAPSTPDRYATPVLWHCCLRWRRDARRFIDPAFSAYAATLRRLSAIGVESGILPSRAALSLRATPAWRYLRAPIFFR